MSRRLKNIKDAVMESSSGETVENRGGGGIPVSSVNSLWNIRSEQGFGDMLLQRVCGGCLLLLVGSGGLALLQAFEWPSGFTEGN